MGLIYKITNKTNGKSYIGLTQFSLEERMKGHINDSRKKDQLNKPLYSAMRKYGVDSFEISLIEECDDDVLSEREIHYIEYYNTYNSGYNATIGGEGVSNITLSDRERMIDSFHRTKSIKESSKELGFDAETISKHLKKSGIDVYMYREEVINKQFKTKSIYCNELNMSFDSITDAARYLVDNSYTRANLGSVRRCISRVVNGERKTYLKMSWISS